MKSNIFKNFTLNNGEIIENRIVMAPMTTWGSNDDHTVSDEEISFYTRRGKNLGMVITGCTHVSKNGIGFEKEFAAYDDKFLDGLTKLATEIKKVNTKAILQINHSGNKAPHYLLDDKTPVSSSNIPTIDTEFIKATTPKSLNEKEIIKIIEDFGKTTERAIKANFDGVEIHAAHGFLIQNFTSPYFNKRSDNWGGSLENRLKFPLKIVSVLKNVIKNSMKPEFILGYRLSPDEPMENALSIEDTLILIDKLIELKVDYIHISLANALNDKPKNYTEPYLKIISKHVNKRIPLIVAGNITTKLDAEKILECGYDFVALGKVLVTDPDWLEKIKNNNKNIQTKLNINNKDLKLPKKLIEEIIKNKGWFYIEE